MGKNDKGKGRKAKDASKKKPNRKKRTSELIASTGIDKSRQLLQSKKLPRVRRKQCLDKNNELHIECGKPMPPLSELERMYAESDEEMFETTSGTSSVNRTTEQNTPPVSNGVVTPITAKKYADEILKLLNDQEIPQTIIPMKKYKKPEVPYIVGCKERPHIPKKPSCNVFKGDDYGISSKTNTFSENRDDQKTPGFHLNGYSLSKSIFNAQVNDIASKLLDNENNPCDSDSDDTVIYDLNSLKNRFSPEPSTSKDCETILKNDQKFIESFVTPKTCITNENNTMETINETIVTRNDIFNIDVDKKDLKVIDKENNSEGIDSNPSSNTPQVNQTVCELAKNNISPLNSSSYDDDIEIIEQPYETIEIHEDSTYTINGKTISSMYNKSENNRNNHIKIENDICEIIDSYNINDSPTIVKKKTSEPTIIDEIDLTNIYVDNVISENKSIINKYNKHKVFRSINLVDDYVAKSKTVENKNTHENVTNMQVGSKNNPRNIIHTTNDQHTSDDIYNPSELEQIITNFFDKRGIKNGPNAFHNQGNQPITLSSHEKSLPVCSFNNIVNITNQSENSITKQIHMSVSKNTKIDQSKNNLSANLNIEMPGQPFLGTCPICLDNLLKEKIGSTQCGHLFCLPCITKALSTKPKRCPTCRKRLFGVGYHQIYMPH